MLASYRIEYTEAGNEPSFRTFPCNNLGSTEALLLFSEPLATCPHRSRARSTNASHLDPHLKPIQLRPDGLLYQTQNQFEQLAVACGTLADPRCASCANCHGSKRGPLGAAEEASGVCRLCWKRPNLGRGWRCFIMPIAARR